MQVSALEMPEKKKKKKRKEGDPMKDGEKIKKKKMKVKEGKLPLIPQLPIFNYIYYIVLALYSINLPLSEY